MTPSEMSRLVCDLQLVNARGRKYFAADELRRFLEATANRNTLRIMAPNARHSQKVPKRVQ